MTAPQAVARDDDALAALRSEVADADRAIVEAINARIDLVRLIRRRKSTLGLPFVDTAQEERLLAALSAGNRGPLSDQGLRQLVGVVLALTKREVARAELRLPQGSGRGSV
jgi:chorismate mutase